uniref:Retrovirus-related Pol polyprotein from transposon TNT 1-94 n=1 Tax=Tanacetum cinerariifolium TaxID=118510 RepID=A0A6L2KBX7_TANCI|nr:retrovirus-related Pol polyprotein from transposon TNT 1-94 [Tanacetum cinerariifolium]
MRLIQSLASKKLVRNLPKLKFDQHFCDACKIRKQAHASHKAKNMVSMTKCLELLHMDLFGPSAIRSYGGNLYTLVIVDDYSRYTWTRFLKNKTEAFDLFKIFSKKIQNQLGCTIVSIRTDQEPKNVNEALTDESWIIAMQEELNQFIADDVWELVPRPRNMTIIGTKWVFRNKLDENDTVSQNKSRILLAYDCALDFKLFQMDVKSAFLNGFINEEVYVAQPLGFIDFEKSNHVYKLKKALYDLKQAPKACEQIVPRFILEFYSKYRINYDSDGEMFVEFVFQNKLFSFYLEEFGQILRIPYECDCSFSNKWSLDDLPYSVPTDGPYQTNPSSLNDIKLLVQIKRQNKTRKDYGMKRGRHSTSLSAFIQPSSSHLNDDDDDDDDDGNDEWTSRASTPSPTRFIN